MEEQEKIDLPDAEQFRREFKQLQYQKNFSRTMRSTIGSLIVVAAIAIILSMLVVPVMRVTGASMTPTLQNEDMLLCVRSANYQKGDIVAFYYNNKILLKRVIGVSGDTINMTEEGAVSINDEPLNEPYVNELAMGECDISLPYQVPESRVFVMGDHRAVSIDSRSTAVGCVSEEAIVGKVLLRIYPFNRFGSIE
ncbi:MAG: signal peptidase I [Oscillospiraceae bacterium]